MDTKILDYYKQPGDITNLEHYRKFIDWLTDDPNAVCQVVQGLIVHDSWFDMYQEKYQPEHEYPQKFAYMEDLLKKVLEIDPSSLAIPRHPRDRVIACCREFATLMCGFLRAKGIPARSRCGFASYFGWNGDYEDHWICEYWNGERWVGCDPQMDPLQLSFIRQWGIESGMDVEQIKKFDPHDLKEDDFMPAGKAWLLCRREHADPQKYGIASAIQPEWHIDSLHGLWFIRGQLLRDFASLNKVETVPYLVRISQGLDWSSWHLVNLKDGEASQEELALLDRIAEYCMNADAHFDEIREEYQQNELLKVPEEILAR